MERSCQATYYFHANRRINITSVTFVNQTSLIVNLMNTGTTDVTITSVTVSGSGVTKATLPPVTVESGKTASFTVTITGELVSGVAYKIELLSSKGNKFFYTSTM
jgi:predicted RNA-binding protein with TRAM domain